MTVLPDFRLIRPGSLDEAVAALMAEGAVPVAGATDLLPNLRRGLGRPRALVDLTAIPAFSAIEERAQDWRIGAGVTLSALAEHQALRQAAPVIAEAALAVAGPTHRAAATLGGNLCQDTRCLFYNQSEWWRSGNQYCLKYQGQQCHVAPRTARCFATYRGDLAPALMVLGAQAELAGPQGSRLLPLADLFQDNGADHLTLQPGEIVAAILVPKQSGVKSGYAKIRIRDAIDFPLVAVAAALARTGDSLTGLRIALTATNSAPLPVALDGLTLDSWNDQAARQVADRVNKTAKLQNTTMVGMKYRRRVLLAATRRLIGGLWDQG